MMSATSENYKCCIMRLTDSRTDVFNFNDVIKTFFMVNKEKKISKTKLEHIFSSFIQVADCRLIIHDPDPDRMADGKK